MATPTRTAPSRLRSTTFEFRAADSQVNGDGLTLDGYAAVFGVPTEIDSWEGCFNEVVAKGSFKRTLNARTPVMQFDHGQDARTGSVPIGAFSSLKEDSTGLHVVGRLFDNPVVEPIRQAIQGGAITGMSFKFRVVRDAWTDNKGQNVAGEDLMDLLWMPGTRGPLTRTIQEVELFEAGPVVFPAYETTSVGVRSMLADLPAEERAALLRDLATELRDSTEPADDAPEGDTGEESPESSALDTDGDDSPNTEPAADDSTSDPGTAEPEPQDQAPATSGTAEQEAATEPERSTQMGTDDRMTVEERASRQTEIRSRLSEINNEHDGAELSPETREEWDSLLDELEVHTRAIHAAQERRAQLLAIDGTNTGKVEGVQIPRNTKTNRWAGVSVQQKPENIYDLAEVRTKALSVEDMPALYRDRALRAIEIGKYAGVDDKAKAQARAEQLLAKDDKDATLAKRMLTTGSPLYQRAFGKAALALSDRTLTSEERAALAVGADATGGYAVPFTLDPTVILTSDGSVNPLRQVARVESIVNKAWHGVTSAGVTVSRGAEASRVSESDPTLAGPVVTPGRVTGFVGFSDEVEEDWNALSSEVTMMLQDAKDTEEASSFVTGDGSANTNVSPYAPGGVIATLADSSLVYAHTLHTLAIDDLYKLEDALPPRFRNANSSFLGNKTIYNVIRGLASAEASLAGDLWVRLTAGQPPELLGYSAYELSTMDSNYADGGNVLALGDFKRGFIIVDRIGMNVELVPHLFQQQTAGSGYGLPTGQRGLLAIWRNSSKVLVDNAIRVLSTDAEPSS